jgi:hypothetical protein
MSAPVRRAALGFSVHTGWAALVAVAPSNGSVPEVIDRRRLELVGDDDPERPRFVFHAARLRPIGEAARFVEEMTALARSRAERAVRAAAEALREAGFRVVASALPAGKTVEGLPLERVLAAHALLHTGEGALFRASLRAASEALRIRVVELPPRGLERRAADALGVAPGALAATLARVGRDAGRPWAKDQRAAYVAAAIALSAPPTDTGSVPW